MWTALNQPPSRSTIIMNQVRGEGRGGVGRAERGVRREGWGYVDSAKPASSSIKVYDYYEPGKR